MAIHNPVTTCGVNSSGDSEAIIITDGAAHVSGAGAFVPSQDYVSDLTMDGTAQGVALATGVALGAGGVTIYNQGATTETIRAAFGTSELDAEANLTIAAAAATTGVIIQPEGDSPTNCLVTWGVPALATHIAIANAVASDTQAVQLVQGVFK